MAGFLTRYGDEIKGVHCANDTIAYGVLEALRAEGIDRHAGRLPTTATPRRSAGHGRRPAGHRLHQPLLGRRRHRGAGLSRGYRHLQAVRGAQGTPRVLRPDDPDHAGRTPRSSRRTISTPCRTTTGRTSGAPATARSSTADTESSGGSVDRSCPPPITGARTGSVEENCVEKQASPERTCIQMGAGSGAAAAGGPVHGVNPTFCPLRNFARIAIASAPALMVAIGVTFIIIMGSIDLSMEGTVVGLRRAVRLMFLQLGRHACGAGLAGHPAVAAVRRGSSALVNGWSM